VVAVPVAPLATYYELKKEADDVVCLVTPDTFLAISQWYGQFGQVSDEEVTRLRRLAHTYNVGSTWRPKRLA